jgi:hypothetical protein
MRALEASSNGGWVFVDAEGGSDKLVERHEAISNLVEFIWGGLSLDSFLLGEDDDSGDKDPPFHNTCKGGIAIGCRTKADLVQGASTLHSTGSGTLTTTASGILIKSEGSYFTDKSLKSCLVLPFDIALWKQAAIILSS